MPEPKKILIVAESIDIEDSSGTKGRVALIHNLKKAGYEILVYHYTRKEISLEGITCVPIKERRASSLFLFSRIERYLRLFLGIKINKPLEKIFGFSFTLFNDRNSIVKGLNNLGKWNPDLIFTLSKGGSFRPHHALLKMPEFHSKWVAYIHDPYPMHLYPRPFNWVEAGYYQKRKFIKEISEKAAYSVFPSKLLMEWMGSYFPNFQNTGFVIPHQLFPFEVSEREVPEYFDPNEFNILHAGTLLGPRNPKTLVLAFEKFLKKFPEARLHSKLFFLGNNTEFFAWLLERKCDFGRMYISKGYVSFDEVFKLQQLASVNVILEAKSEISPFLPGKFPHCVIANKPILLLGPAFSESRRLLGDKYPYWAEIDDLDRISYLIGQLYKNWKREPNNLRLNRPDLENYLSEDFLKKVMGLIFEKKEKFDFHKNNLQG